MPRLHPGPEGGSPDCRRDTGPQGNQSNGDHWQLIGTHPRVGRVTRKLETSTEAGELSAAIQSIIKLDLGLARGSVSAGSNRGLGDVAVDRVRSQGLRTATVSFEGSQYRIAGVPVHQATAATEGKVVLADMSKINLIFNGPAHLLADGLSGGKSTFGTTELIVMNWLDSAITDPATVVIGSA